MLLRYILSQFRIIHKFYSLYWQNASAAARPIQEIPELLRERIRPESRNSLGLRQAGNWLRPSPKSRAAHSACRCTFLRHQPRAGVWPQYSKGTKPCADSFTAEQSMAKP